MSQLGTHFIAEFWECPGEVLNDHDRLRDLTHEAAMSARVTVLNSQFHQFSPHGVTGILLLSESHLSIHTWPERGYCATDLFTCGDPVAARDALLELASRMGAGRVELQTIARGCTGAIANLSVESRILYPPFQWTPAPATPALHRAHVTEE